ncbi:MAG: hypothetical protein HIU81_02665 [Acidobacteria bacterium]|nr:hypothetical protein [Acidobacteriota bacterium]
MAIYTPEPAFPRAAVRSQNSLNQVGLPGQTAELPRWPFSAVFLGYPVWWLLGLSDLVWIAAGAVMFLYLVRHRSTVVPKAFFFWGVFLVWMLCSVIGIDNSDRLIGFVYRALIYISLTIMAVYIYNARKQLTPQYVLGCLTFFWAVVVIGGYLGILFPLVIIHTPLSLILPSSLMQNELVNQMAIRRLTQYNPAAWDYIDPRPSAPFLYTNNWGAAFSLLMPLVIAYLVKVRGTRRFWLILVGIPISFVPAFLTLNRGMFLGLGIALFYAALRFALTGNKKGLAAIFGIGVLVAVALILLPVAERLQNRLQVSSTTQDRESLYTAAIDQTKQSPIFGFGAPRPSQIPGAPSVGTQGQIWMVLYSHGFVGALLFLVAFLVMFFATLRRHDALGLACNTVLLVSLVEIFYYGMLASGLGLMLLVGALGLATGEPAMRRGKTLMARRTDIHEPHF